MALSATLSLAPLRLTVGLLDCSDSIRNRHGEGTMPWVCNWARGRGAMKVFADGRWKAVDYGEVVDGNRLIAVIEKLLPVK